MELKTLTKDHINDILCLETESGPDKPLYVRYNEEALNFIFDHPETCGAVGMFEGKKLLAWGAYRTDWRGHNKEEGIYEVSSIVVDKAHRGKGLGGAILKDIIDRIKHSQKYKEIYLTVSPLNLNALMLYLKNGFVINDFQKDVYGPGTDRVFLSLKEN